MPRRTASGGSATPRHGRCAPPAPTRRPRRKEKVRTRGTGEQRRAPAHEEQDRRTPTTRRLRDGSATAAQRRALGRGRATGRLPQGEADRRALEVERAPQRRDEVPLVGEVDPAGRLTRSAKVGGRRSICDGGLQRQRRARAPRSAAARWPGAASEVSSLAERPAPRLGGDAVDGRSNRSAMPSPRTADGEAHRGVVEKGQPVADLLDDLGLAHHARRHEVPLVDHEHDGPARLVRVAGDVGVLGGDAPPRRRSRRGRPDSARGSCSAMTTASFSSTSVTLPLRRMPAVSTST